MAEIIPGPPPTEAAFQSGILDARVVAAGALISANDPLTYLRNAQDGDPRRLYAFYSEILARDAHLESETAKAAEYVAGSPMEIKVPSAIVALYGRDSSEFKQAEEIARIVRATVLAAQTTITDATSHLVTSGFGMGVAALNLVVEPGAGFEGKERIVSLEGIASQRLCWGVVAGLKGPDAVKWMLQPTDDTSKLEPVEKWGNGLLVFTPEAVVPNLARRGFLRRCIVPAMIRIYGVTWWARAVETSGMPVRFGYYPEGDDKQKAAVTKILKAIGTDAFAALPQGAKVEVVGNVLAGATPHEAIVEWAAREESKASLGATQTTEVQVGAGSKASAEIHDIVILRRTMTRARRISAFYQHQLVLPYVARNWGPEQAAKFCPEVSIRVSGGIDRQAIALTILTARQAGIQLAKHDAYDMMEWPMPGEDDELLGEDVDGGQEAGMGGTPLMPGKPNQRPAMMGKPGQKMLPPGQAEETSAAELSVNDAALEKWALETLRSEEEDLVDPFRKIVAAAQRGAMDNSEAAARVLYEFGSRRGPTDKLAAAMSAVLAHATLTGIAKARREREGR